MPRNRQGKLSKQWSWDSLNTSFMRELRDVIGDHEILPQELVACCVGCDLIRTLGSDLPEASKVAGS